MGNSPPNSVQPISSIQQQAINATNQVNNLIAHSNDAIMCGPTCQREKQLSNLEDKYVNAKNNIQNAPEQLKSAKKEYYLALDGQAGYNKMILDKVTKDAKKTTDSLKKKFDETGENIDNLIRTYETLLLNHKNINDFTEEYITENIKISKELKKIRGDIITNDRKTYYEQQNLDNLMWWYNLFRILYIIFLIFLIIAVLFKVEGWVKKMLLILFFVFYPIFINSVASYIIGSIKYILTTTLPKDVYLTL